MRHTRFTLLDLLVVVFLVVLIFAFLSPMCMHGRSREKARRVNCAGNLKQIGLALLMYSGDNGGAFPVESRRGANDFEPLNTLDVLDDGKVYACPSTAQSLTLARNSNYRYRGSGFEDTDDPAMPDEPMTYSRITIAYDASGNHPDNQWMNALFIDGHAEGAKPDGKKEPNGWNVTQ